MVGQCMTYRASSNRISDPCDRAMTALLRLALTARLGVAAPASLAAWQEIYEVRGVLQPWIKGFSCDLMGA